MVDGTTNYVLIQMNAYRDDNYKNSPKFHFHEQLIGLDWAKDLAFGNTEIFYIVMSQIRMKSNKTWLQWRSNADMYYHSVKLRTPQQVQG